jgi:hypothetical protein
MHKPAVKCALLAAMVAKHRWGTPMNCDDLLAIAAVETHEYATARNVDERLREKPYVTNRGDREIELDTAAFGRLADVLYHECDWDATHVKSRLKHYEGWGDHEWA